MIVQDQVGVNLNSPNLAPEKYVVVKNHVRELKNNAQVESEIEDEIKDEVIEQKVSKPKKRKRKISNTESIERISKCSEISKYDLEELRTVYNKCKKVMKNIENKYGHLLNSLTEPELISSDLEEFDGEEACKCEHNKKIVFDDEGKQILKDLVFDKHICIKNHDRKDRDRFSNINVEYEHQIIQKDAAELPDNLNDLENILKRPMIENQLRTRIIHKIRGLRFDYTQELRFNRQMLVEKLKSNPDDMLTFPGTNLSTLSGYRI